MKRFRSFGPQSGEYGGGWVRQTPPSSPPPSSLPSCAPPMNCVCTPQVTHRTTDTNTDADKPVTESHVPVPVPVLPQPRRNENRKCKRERREREREMSEINLRFRVFLGEEAGGSGAGFWGAAFSLSTLVLVAVVLVAVRLGARAVLRSTCVSVSEVSAGGHRPFASLLMDLREGFSGSLPASKSVMRCAYSDDI